MIKRASFGDDRSFNSIDVLICDDEPDNAWSLKNLFQLYGYSVRTVSDGFAALAAVAERPPQVILLNIRNRKMCGYDAARRLRGLAVGNNLILIALTGLGMAKDLQDAFAAGFDSHLLKPPRFEDIHRTIQRLIAERSARQGRSKVGISPPV